MKINIKVSSKVEMLGSSNFQLTTKDGKKLENMAVGTIRQVLKDENGNIITLPYYSIKRLSRDHYVVLDVADTVNSDEAAYYEGVPVTNQIPGDSLKLKFGIIRVNRDSRGNIIPFAEEKVFPCICNSIVDGSCETAILENYKGRYHYLELDITSKNYGKPLVLSSLKSAKPFDDRLFAECSFSGKYYKGYIPRDVSRVEISNNRDLLSSNEVRYLDGEDTKLTDEAKLAIDAKASILCGDITSDKKPLLKSIY